MTEHAAQHSFVDVQDYYRRLRDRSDIGVVAHELVGDRITSETRSTIYVDCPRHESQSGRSFQVSLHQGAWFCHACKLGGGTIELVEFVRFGTVTRCSRSGVSDTHRQARDWLAETLGMPKLSEAGLSPEKIAEQEKLRAETEQVFACLTAYAEFCHAALLANPEALAWLKENYAIVDETVAQHRVGWADDAGAFDHLVERGFAPEIIAATGLFRVDLASPAPFFRKRIVFPYWADGRVTYMTGRRTPWSEDTEWELAKYKKLPLHDEKKHPRISKAITNSALFGEDVLRTRPPQVVLTEGITDAIASMQAGFATVSPATVNISDTDFERIVAKLKGVEGVHIVFDNELSAVGADSAVQIARRLDHAGIPAEIVTLPLREKQEKARAEFGASLGELRNSGVALRVVGDKLRFSPKRAVTPELLARMVTAKRELVELLGGAEGIHDFGDGDRPCVGRCPTCGELDFVRPRAGGPWRCARCRPYDLPGPELEWWPPVGIGVPFASWMLDLRAVPPGAPDPRRNPRQCWSCGGTRLWRLLPDGLWTCARCHPPLPPAEQIETITVGEAPCG